MSCRETAEKFKISKTEAAKVVANEAHLRAEYENFQGKGYKHIQRGNHHKFKAVNDILYSWHKKREASGIYVTRPILKEEAMNIKPSLN